MARSFIIFIALAIVHACPAQSPGSKQLAVIAYYSGNGSDITQYAINQLTHIIYSFAHVKGNRLYVSAPAGAILRKLVSLKKTYPALKVLLAFGGWGGCATCSPLFANSDNRKAFARSVQEILDQYQLDGIDIDWEYPAIQGPVGHPFAPSDKQNFTALIQELRLAVGHKKEVSVATGAFTEYLQSSLEWNKVAAQVNRLHLMTFDLVNRLSVNTGHHTALYTTHIQKESAANALRYLDSLKIPRNKIVIGAACYARIYEQTDSINNGLYRPCRFKGFAVYKTYEQVFSAKNGYTCYQDEEAKAPFCYNAGKKQFATFDDIGSVKRKTKFAIDNQLQGIMFWELRQDKTRNGLLNAIYEVKTSNTAIP